MSARGEKRRSPIDRSPLQLPGSLKSRDKSMGHEAIARAAHPDAAATTRGSDAAPLKLTLTSDALSERSRRIWSSGEYDRIAAGFRHEAEAFVARLGLQAGQPVLDAACGSGNLT